MTREVDMDNKITVVGGGSWGTALAHLMASKGYEVTMLVRGAEQAEEISRTHTNARYLPDLVLAPSLRAVTDAHEALDGVRICVLAVPCQHLRCSLRALAPFTDRGIVPVCASKGIELGTLRRMAEVVAGEWPEAAGRYAILSGPSFAREVVRGKPTTVVLGCTDKDLGAELRAVFSTELFRVYSSEDVAGVELGGAVKNVMAIAAGVCDGLELGHNARAGLITRGLAEMSRLGVAMGARAATFMGLSGLGDLVLTCTGDLSRNRQVGLRLARGESLERICMGMHMVAEGVSTSGAVCALGKALKVDLPVAGAVERMLRSEARPPDLVRELMTRALREE